MSNILSPEQVRMYNELGFVSGITIFDADEVDELNRQFARLCELLDEDETPYAMDGWERHNTWLYDLVLNPRLLDCVEDVIGPNFYQWGSNFLCKMPHEGIYIPWHQDLHDWPLTGGEVLTVWIAFDDVDAENGCLRMLPATNHIGRVAHTRRRPEPRGADVSLLPFYADPERVPEPDAVNVALRAGQISLHSASVIHGSEGNRSDRRRCGFTTCYAATSVVCDTSVRNENGDWSDFAVYMCRGVDEYGHNAVADPPTGFGRARRKDYRILTTDA